MARMQAGHPEPSGPLECPGPLQVAQLRIEWGLSAFRASPFNHRHHLTTTPAFY